MNPNARLNESGIMRLLPFLGELTSAYDDHGGIVLTIEEGSLWVDNPNPLVLIDEAKKEGISLICTKIDNGGSYYDVYVEQAPTIIGTSAPGIETDVYKAEPVGAAAKRKVKVGGVWKEPRKGAPPDQALVDAIMQQVEEKLEEFLKMIGEKFAK